MDTVRLFGHALDHLRGTTALPDTQPYVSPEVVVLWLNDSMLGIYGTSGSVTGMEKAEIEATVIMQQKRGTWNTLEYSDKRRRWYSDKVARLECETRKVG